MSWASEELRHTNLGDARLNRRLVGIVEDLMSSPESSVPQASRSAAALQGMYDFWSNRRVSAEGILEGHRRATVERMEGYAVVYAIQDTTDLDYTSHPATEGIGKLSGKTRGLKLHSVLCVDENGRPYGVIHQQVWGRAVARSETKRRQMEEKESYRWIESLRRTEELVPDTTRVVTICDREADIYELFATPRRINSELLIRIYHERQVQMEGVEAVEPLSELLGRSEIRGEVEIELQRTPRRKARRARLSVRFERVTMQPPSSHAEREELPEIAVTIVWAHEETPPSESERISWLLVSTMPMWEFKRAKEVLEMYSLRWVIERYHYCLKGGCRVEQLQLSTAERLEKAIATYVVVAWRFLYLTYTARGYVKPCSEDGFAQAERETLYGYYNRGAALPSRAPGSEMFVRWVAQLGGYIGRRSDGPPGAKVIWRGMRRLRDLMATSPVSTAVAPEYECC